MEKLTKGFGKGHVLYLDCFSGLSGDMIMAALLDLGVPFDFIDEVVKALPLDGFAIRTERENRRSMDVARFYVDVDEAKQPHRHFGNIKTMIESAEIDEQIKKIAVEIFYGLAKAEARVHGTTVENVHFHEVGAVDSIVDIVGAAAGISYIGADVVCRAVPVGTGFVNTQHGQLPLPAPATLFLLEGIPVEGTQTPAELTTPTGAAIVKAVCKGFGPLPQMTPVKIGMGAGSRCLEERSGILRAILGRPAGGSGQACALIEANIDDATGELLGHTMEKLFVAGCLDTWVEAIQMKKGRPAYKLSVLCKKEAVFEMGALVMAETTTIGIRYMDVGRMEMTRELVQVETPFGPVSVKVSKGANGSTNAAPEFEDCRKLAQENNVPLKQVMAVAGGLAQKLLAQ